MVQTIRSQDHKWMTLITDDGRQDIPEDARAVINIAGITQDLRFLASSSGRQNEKGRKSETYDP